jgi:hypothetical protein
LPRNERRRARQRLVVLTVAVLAVALEAVVISAGWIGFSHGD